MHYSSGSVRRLRDDIWQARFIYRSDEGGVVTKRQVARNFRAKSAREAKQRKAEIHAELEREAETRRIYSPTGGNRLLSEYLASYIETQERIRAIEATTAANYRSCIKHILRYVSDKPIKSVTADDVIRMDASLLADGLCNCTVSKAHRFLKQVLDRAAANGDILENPITRLSARPPKRQHREPNSLDDETRRFLLGILDGMEDTPLTLAIRLGLSTGMRNEEVVGLRWGDVNLAEGTVEVRNCITLANGKIIEKGPKTSSGRRSIPLDPALCERLSARLRNVFGLSTTSKCRGKYVLGDASGRFYHPTELSKQFRALAGFYGIVGTKGEPATFYSLRHTFATTLLQRGVDAKTVASLMGHSSVAETLNTYASTDPAARAAAGSVVAELMKER